MGLERMQGNGVEQGDSMFARKRWTSSNDLFGARVNQEIIKHVQSCPFSTLVRSEGNVDKIMCYCLMK